MGVGGILLIDAVSVVFGRAAPSLSSLVAGRVSVCLRDV